MGSKTEEQKKKGTVYALGLGGYVSGLWGAWELAGWAGLSLFGGTVAMVTGILLAGDRRA